MNEMQGLCGTLFEVSHPRDLKQPSVWENAKSHPTEQAPKGGIGGKAEKRPFFIPHITAKINVHVGTVYETTMECMPVVQCPQLGSTKGAWNVCHFRNSACLALPGPEEMYAGKAITALMFYSELCKSIPNPARLSLGSIVTEKSICQTRHTLSQALFIAQKTYAK